MDGTNIYIHSGVSVTVTSTIAHGLSDVYDIMYDGTDLWVVRGTGIVNQLTGLTATVQSTINVAGVTVATKGLAYNGDRLIVGEGGGTPIIYIVERTGEVVETFSAPIDVGNLTNEIMGLAYGEGDILIVEDQITNSDLVWRLDGFTHAVVDSFATPRTQSRGIEYIGTNIVTGNFDGVNKIYIHNGIAAYGGVP